ALKLGRSTGGVGKFKLPVSAFSTVLPKARICSGSAPLRFSATRISFSTVAMDSSPPFLLASVPPTPSCRVRFHISQGRYQPVPIAFVLFFNDLRFSHHRRECCRNETCCRCETFATREGLLLNGRRRSPLLASPQGGVAERSRKCRDPSFESEDGVVFRAR